MEPTTERQYCQLYQLLNEQQQNEKATIDNSPPADAHSVASRPGEQARTGHAHGFRRNDIRQVSKKHTL